MHVPSDWASGRRRKAEQLKSRLECLANDASPRCSLPGCNRPSAVSAGNGLSTLHCRYHLQLRNRHGSLWKKSIPGPALRPYARAAERFLKANAEDTWIASALSGLDGLLASAGPWQHPSKAHSRYMNARGKARASLARLREANVPPRRLLAAYMAVAGAIAQDPIKPGGEPGEYRRVQAAKAVFRLASGFHDGAYPRYPRSAGRVLRVLGGMLEEACGDCCDVHLEAVLAVKATGVVLKADGGPALKPQSPPAPEPLLDADSLAERYP